MLPEYKNDLPPKRGDLVIHNGQDGEPYVCIGWIRFFLVLMPLKKEPELVSPFWFEYWENSEEGELTVLSLPDPVRKAWANILPKTITPVAEIDLK